MIVIDASVAAKSYLNEAGTDAAIALMTGHEQLIAPQLIQVEVIAAICGNVRKGALTEQEAEDRCNRWLRHLADDVMLLHPDRMVLDNAAGLALTYKHPVQDCVYLAVANHFKVPMITADGRFLKKVASAYSNISLLSGCSAN